MRKLLGLFLLLPLTCIPALAGGPAPAGQDAADPITRFVVALAQDHAWTMTVLLLVGAARVLNKPFFSLLHAHVAKTPGKYDDELLAKVENSKALRVFLWLADLLASVKPLPVTPVQKKIADAIARGSAVVLLGLVLCGAMGCASMPTGADGNPDLSRFAPAVKTAAMIGTSEALDEHPEWAMEFDRALKDLRKLEAAEVIDLPAVLAIVRRLPVEKLKSREARLAIAGGTILLVDYGGRATAVDLESVRPFVTALRQGIELGWP